MIDPILLQNKEVIDKVYEHINIMTSITKHNNNKMILYSLVIILLSSYCYLNKEKILNSLEFIKRNDVEIDTKINSQEESPEVVNEIREENEIEEELSDFEY